MDKRFVPVISFAQTTQRKYGVPTSVSLAQWAIESAYGTKMPKGSNNPFGIKAVKGQASASAPTKEYRHGHMVHESQPFAVFASQADAFDAHGKLLATHADYAPAMKAWLAGDLAGGVALMAKRYATDPNYATTVMNTIAWNGLSEFDKLPASPAAASAAKPAAPAAAAKAPSIAAAKAPTMPTPTLAKALDTSSVNVFAGAIHTVETVAASLASSLKAAVSPTTSSAVSAATGGSAIVADFNDGKAALADIRQAIADAEAGKWGNEPHDAIDFLKHVFAILTRSGVNLPVVSQVVEALPDLPVAA